MDNIHPYAAHAKSFAPPPKMRSQTFIEVRAGFETLRIRITDVASPNPNKWISHTSIEEVVKRGAQLYGHQFRHLDIENFSGSNDLEGEILQIILSLSSKLETVVLTGGPLSDSTLAEILPRMQRLRALSIINVDEPPNEILIAQIKEQHGLKRLELSNLAEHHFDELRLALPGTIIDSIG